MEGYESDEEEILWLGLKYDIPEKEVRYRLRIFQHVIQAKNPTPRCLRQAIYASCRKQELMPTYNPSFICAISHAYRLDMQEERCLREYNEYALDPELLTSEYAKAMSHRLKRRDVHSINKLLADLYKVWEKHGYLETIPEYKKILSHERNFVWGKTYLKSARADAQKAFAQDPLFQKNNNDEEYVDSMFSSGLAYV
ncbi:MAG: hypothetical protein Q8P11_01300 [bacterium]|nr:hypothetical protein [bacterium]